MTDPSAGRIHRAAARVLPVCPQGEVLLLQEQDPVRPGELYWADIGGGIDAGETPEQTARRELAEEVGVEVAVDALVGPIHQAAHPFSWNGVDYLGRFTFFAVPLARETAISFAAHEPEEVGNILRAQWWTPQALRADGTACRASLPAIMETAIAAVGGDR